MSGTPNAIARTFPILRTTLYLPLTSPPSSPSHAVTSTNRSSHISPSSASSPMTSPQAQPCLTSQYLLLLLLFCARAIQKDPSQTLRPLRTLGHLKHTHTHISSDPTSAPPPLRPPPTSPISPQAKTSPPTGHYRVSLPTPLSRGAPGSMRRRRRKPLDHVSSAQLDRKTNR